MKKYGNYSYADIMLYPLADALAQSGTSSTRIYFGMQVSSPRQWLPFISPAISLQIECFGSECASSPLLQCAGCLLRLEMCQIFTAPMSSCNHHNNLAYL